MTASRAFGAGPAAIRLSVTEMLVKSKRVLAWNCREARVVLLLAVAAAIPFTASGQTPDPLTVTGKLQFHAEAAYAPMSLVGLAVYAAVLQEDRAPEEWREGGEGYGERVASVAAWAGIHGALAFGLDSTLHQDPRYFRSSGKGFWRRTGHALRGTILTRTDRGGETLSTWRLGSDYGSAFLSNLWYPDRLDTARLGFIQGSVTLGFDLLGNLGREFWPEIRKKVLRRK